MKSCLLLAGFLALSACSNSNDSDGTSQADNPVPVVPDTPTPTPTATATPTTDTPPPVTPKDPAPVYEVKEQSFDATQKGVWIYHGLKVGELVRMSQLGPWIIGTSRYMWRTNSGSSGTSGGGAYVVKVEAQSFDDISLCDPARFVTDIMIPQLGSVSEEVTANWFDIADPVPTPLDVSFVIGRDKDCIKVKLLSYEKGLYSFKYKRLQ